MNNDWIMKLRESNYLSKVAIGCEYPNFQGGAFYVWWREVNILKLSLNIFIAESGISALGGIWLAEDEIEIEGLRS